MFQFYFKTIILLTLATSSISTAIIVKKQPKIVIVGAGLSGITAAVHLIKNGFKNLKILEAEDRYGGRIHSVPFSGGKIDLGAQWVHGETNNIIFEMLNGTYDFGLTGFDEHSNLFLQSDGVLLDQKKCGKFSDMALEILFSCEKEQANFGGSIGDFFKRKYDKLITKESKDDKALAIEMMDYYEKEMNIWNGSETWFDLSSQLNCISGSNEGKQYMTWNRDGYEIFFKYLMQQLPRDSVLSKILYKKEVVNVQWNPNYEFKKVITTCSDGHKYFADHLIFTPSLGVLKEKYRSLFSPQLPTSIIQAINSMGFGTIGKIFLEFKEPFWPTNIDWVGYGFLWTDEQKFEIKGTKREW